MPRERLSKGLDRELRSFLGRIRGLSPRCVILFGSYARGDFTEGSDADVCVIAERLPNEELKRRTLFSIPMEGRIRAIGFAPDEFLRYLRTGRFLAYDIMAEGVTLFDDGFYSKARREYEICLEKYGITREYDGWRIRRPELIP